MPTPPMASTHHSMTAPPMASTHRSSPPHNTLLVESSFAATTNTTHSKSNPKKNTHFVNLLLIATLSTYF